MARPRERGREREEVYIFLYDVSPWFFIFKTSLFFSRAIFVLVVLFESALIFAAFTPRTLS